MASSLVESQDLILLAFSIIGSLSLLNHFFKLTKWLYRTFLRPPKKLTTYGSWALVTGCTDGIGKAITFELASKGLNLVLVSRNPQKLQTTSNEILQTFGNKIQIKIIVLDFAKTTKGEEIVAKIKTEINGLDVGILVNNAGTVDKGVRFFHEFDVENSMNLVNVNVGSVVWVTKAVIDSMLKRKKGVIVNIGSGSSVVLSSYPLSSIYASTKAFINMFSRSLSLEYQQHGIDIQCQIPLFVATNMVSMAIDKTSFFIPSAKQYGKASIRWMGYELFCLPYWTHALQWWLMSGFPDLLCNWVYFQMALSVRKKYLREEKNKNATTM